MQSDKRTRQQTLLLLLKEKEVSSQEELLALLEARGVLTNQSAISRDLKEFGVTKRGGIYVLPSDETKNVLKEVKFAGDNLMVVRTAPGQAMALAARIDNKNSSYIVGTIAGDDTIFIAIEDKKNRVQVVNMLHHFV